MAFKQKTEPRFGGLSSLWRLSEWIGILLYAVLIYQYVTVWSDPGPDDGAKIATLSMMILFEFVLAHSGIFMAAFPRKMALYIFVPFYGIFALSFNAIVPGNTIILLYCGVVLVRMRFIFSDPSDSARGRALGMSVISMILFMFCMVGSAATESILPKLGLTDAYLTAIDYRNIVNGSGDFIDSPHAALAAGTVYFTLLALAEIWIYGLLRKRQPAL